VEKKSQNMWPVWLSKMILAKHSFFAQFAEAGEKKNAQESLTPRATSRRV